MVSWHYLLTDWVQWFCEDHIITMIRWDKLKCLPSHKHLHPHHSPAPWSSQHQPGKPIKSILTLSQYYLSQTVHFYFITISIKSGDWRQMGTGQATSQLQINFYNTWPELMSVWWHPEMDTECVSNVIMWPDNGGEEGTDRETEEVGHPLYAEATQ